MKALKISAFVSIVLLFIAFVIYDVCRIIYKLPGLDFVLYQYVMIGYQIAIPINLIYLFKRLK
jgi:hypothetical protein